MGGEIVENISEDDKESRSSMGTGFGRIRLS
jgi:hypothetical protein